MDNKQYFDELKSKVVAVLSDRPRTFRDLVSNCEGAFPTTVLEALHAIMTVYPLQRVMEEVLVLDHRTDPSEYESFAIDTIEGNPILSSWYFTRNTCHRIGRIMNWTGLRLAFFGTPKLFEWFSHRGFGEERFLLDSDPLVLATFSRVESKARDYVMPYDAHRPVPQDLIGRFDCVFFDPPWYVNDYLLWLGRALVLAPYGKVFLSLLPRLTRPDADRDRRVILDRCRSDCEDLFLISEFLDYDVPTYERSQLSAAGIDALSSWKVADLVLLNRTKPTSNDGRDWPDTSLQAKQWVEVDVGNLRFFVSERAASIHCGALLQPPPGSSILLRSPSRREPARAVINVLTSRGHGLCTSDPSRLRRVLAALSQILASGLDYDEAATNLGLDSTTDELLRSILEPEGGIHG